MSECPPQSQWSNVIFCCKVLDKSFASTIYFISYLKEIRYTVSQRNKIKMIPAVPRTNLSFSSAHSLQMYCFYLQAMHLSRTVIELSSGNGRQFKFIK